MDGGETIKWADWEREENLKKKNLCGKIHVLLFLRNKNKTQTLPQTVVFFLQGRFTVPNQQGWDAKWKLSRNIFCSTKLGADFSEPCWNSLRGRCWLGRHTFSWCCDWLSLSLKSWLLDCWSLCSTTFSSSFYSPPDASFSDLGFVLRVTSLAWKKEKQRCIRWETKSCFKCTFRSEIDRERCSHSRHNMEDFFFLRPRLSQTSSI